MELPTVIECPVCRTKNEVNLVDFAEGHVITCSGCQRDLLVRGEPIKAELKDVNAILRETQSSILKNFVGTSAIIAVAIFLVIISVSKVVNIQIEGEVFLFILGIFGTIFAVLLGFLWLIKKWFALFK